MLLLKKQLIRHQKSSLSLTPYCFSVVTMGAVFFIFLFVVYFYTDFPKFLYFFDAFMNFCTLFFQYPDQIPGVSFFFLKTYIYFSGVNCFCLVLYDAVQKAKVLAIPLAYKKHFLYAFQLTFRLLYSSFYVSYPGFHRLTYFFLLILLVFCYHCFILYLNLFFVVLSHFFGFCLFYSPLFFIFLSFLFLCVSLIPFHQNLKNPGLMKKNNPLFFWGDGMLLLFLIFSCKLIEISNYKVI